MSIALTYRSGEQVQKGDKVLICGFPGVIELVAFDPDDAEQAWHLKTSGPGVMIAEPKHFGHVFTGCDDDELEFVGRG